MLSDRETANYLVRVNRHIPRNKGNLIKAIGHPSFPISSDPHAHDQLLSVDSDWKRRLAPQLPQRKENQA
jgi:hypothetical protein